MTDRVTIKDVARRAEVSVATVSAVLNKNKYVSPELVERVSSVVAELGYHPNLIARSLKVNSTHAIGLIFTNITSAIWPPLVRQVQECTRSQGFDTILSATNENRELEEQALKTMIARQVDGILIGPTASAEYEHIHESARRVPLVAIDRAVPGIESVTMDNEQATYAATTHLIEHGRRRIGILCTPTVGSNSAARLAGYQRALQEHGLYDAALVGKVDFFGYNALELAQNLLVGRQADALLSTSQSTTIAALKTANALRMHIPDDLALFCYDDAPWMEAVRPALSTVRQTIEEMALLASNLLFSHIGGATNTGENHVLSCDLILRESCGCCWSPDDGRSAGSPNIRPK